MKKGLILFTVIVFSILTCSCELIDKETKNTDDQKNVTMTDFKTDVSVGYEIFVTSFANGDTSNDVKDKYSGDIKGITNNLDYIKSLGVNCLWLTPVHESDSYHGYDVIDYFSINDAFGTEEDYLELLSEAHKRGIYVLLDFVINHTSLNNEWFTKAIEGDLTYEKYYRIQDTSGNGFSKNNGKYYYACFDSTMPDLNYDNAVTYNAILDVAKYWLDNGVDGFRIDGAKHVYNSTLKDSEESANASSKNLDFFKKFYQDIKKLDSEAFVLLELYDTNTSYIAPYYEGMDSCFNFSMQSNITEAIKMGNSSLITGAYESQIESYSSFNNDYIDSFFLSNHDIERVYSTLGNDDLAKLASNILFTMPGISWIYYGDELGMSGAKKDQSYADMAYRQGFVWKNEYTTSASYVGNYSTFSDLHNRTILSPIEQEKEDNSMLTHYQKWANLKSTDSVLKYGDFKDVYFDNDLYAYTRSYNNTTYLVIHNLQGKNKIANYDLNGASIVLGDGVINTNSITLGGYSSVIIKLGENSTGGGNIIQKGITVYYYNENNWDKVYYYTWGTNGSNSTGDWPGKLMDKTNDNWYSITIDNATATSIIFNNGSGGSQNQTDDLKVQAGTWWYYKGTWYNNSPI